MKWLLVSLLLFVPLTAEQNKQVKIDEDPVGDFFLADQPYNDWFTKDYCDQFKGEICWTGRCGDSTHYVNEFCCCGIKYNRLPIPLDDQALIAAGAKPDALAEPGEIALATI